MLHNKTLIFITFWLWILPGAALEHKQKALMPKFTNYLGIYDIYYVIY